MFEKIKSQENISEQNALRVGRAIEHNLKNALLYEGDNPEKISTILSIFKSRIMRVFPEQKDVCEALFRELEDAHIDNEEFLVTEVSQKIGPLLASNYSLEEIEKQLQPDFKEDNGMEKINRLVDVEIVNENNILFLRLHIPITFVQNPIEIKTLFIEALRILATKVVSENKYRDIKGLLGYSTLIYKNSQIAENLGFIVTNKNDESGAGEMMMTIETLMHLYGEKTYINP